MKTFSKLSLMFCTLFLMNTVYAEKLTYGVLMKTLSKIYKKHTNIDESEETTLKDLLKRDLWLSSSECLKYGMVDSVE